MVGIKLGHDAVKFVFDCGDEVAQLHLLQFLGMLDTKTGRDLIVHLLGSQMPSGGFPSKLDGRIEGTRETCGNATFVLSSKTGMPFLSPNS